MPGLHVNLSEVDSGSNPFPSGRYVLNITDGEIRDSQSESAKHKGSQYIAWTFRVAVGDHTGRYVWDNTILSHGDCDCPNEAEFNKGLFKLKGLLAATGKWTEEELNAPDFDFEIEDVVGSTIAAQVGIRKSDEFGDANNIKNYKLVKEEEFASLDDLP